MAVEIGSERLQRMVEKVRLEGVLASLKHIGELASSETTLEELKQKLARYFNQASSAVANH